MIRGYGTKTPHDAVRGAGAAAIKKGNPMQRISNETLRTSTI
jgi:hypothetical protein